MRSRPAIAVLLGALLSQAAVAQWVPARSDNRNPPRARMMPQPRQAPPAPAWRGEREPAPNYLQPQAQRNLSVGDAAQRAQQMNGGGRILSVDPHEQGYRVKVLKDGEVRVINVPH